jgi:hypothetical protein
MTVAPARSSATDMVAVWGSFSTTTSPGPTRGRQRPGVMVSSPVEGRELVDPEDASIAWLAMQLVVKALGHPEELGRTAYHHPSHVDPRASPVRQQRTTHLRNSTAESGRVHLPHRPSTQQLTGVLLGLRQALDHRLEQVMAKILENAESQAESRLELPPVGPHSDSTHRTVSASSSG